MSKGDGELAGDEREVLVGSVAALSHGSAGTVVEVEGREIGLFRLGEEFIAYDNRCPHQGGPVCRGDVVGRVEAILREDRSVAGERFDETDLQLVCPWHGWEFSLSTGRCSVDPTRGLRRYPVSVRGEDVYLVLR